MKTAYCMHLYAQQVSA